MRLRTAGVVALGLSLLVPAAAAEGKRKPAKRVAKVRLASFDNCTELVGYARGQALRTGGLPGVSVRALPPTAISLAPGPTVMSERAAGVPTAAPQAPAAVEDTSNFSGTNNQEAAVDESDIVKTDGKRAFIVYGEQLLAVDVTGDTPKLVGSLKLEGNVAEILLRGKRLLAVGSGATGPGPGARAAARAGRSSAGQRGVDRSLLLRRAACA